MTRGDGREAIGAGSVGAPFLDLATLRRGASAWAGVACLFAWTNLLLCFEGALRDTAIERGGIVHDPFFFAATLTAGLLLVAASAVGRCRAARPRAGHAGERVAHSPSPVARRATWTLAALGSVAGASALLLAWLAPDALPALPPLSGAVAGAFVAWATLAWASALARMDLRAALLATFTAACLEWLPLVVLDTLPLAGRVALVALLPPASVACLARTARGLGRADAGEETVAVLGAGAGTSGADGTGAGVIARMALMTLTFFCVIQLMWSYFIKMLVNRLDVGLFSLVFLFATFASCLVLGLCVAAMRRQRAYRLELFYRTAFVTCLAGVVACGMAVGDADAASVLPSYLLVYGGFSLASPTVWMLALGCAHMGRHRATAVFGPVIGCQYLGMLLGALAVDAMARLAGTGAGTALLPRVMLACTLMLAIAYVAIFPERDLLSLSPLLFGMTSESIELRCRQVAAERGLTPREAEILALLARGRDVAFISEQLCISRNTASAHRKSIYAKLDVHSQQELMSVVESASEP